MKLTRNTRAISRLLLILLLLTATVIGAILSYLWVIGGVINLGIRVPDKTTLSITNVTFIPQNTTFFDLTLLNPSYSPSEANILQIATTTEDGHLYNIGVTNPSLPYKLGKAKEESFRCFWNWANYTGQSVRIVAFIEDGSGPTFEANAPFVNLKITDLRFNSTISVSRFNMTVENLPASVTYVNITDVAINREIISHENFSVSLPYPLDPEGSVSFMCTWDWTNYQDKNVTVAVYTLQGYAAYLTRLTPKPVTLNITKVLFNVTDTTHFNVTVQNSEDSPTHVDITNITVTVGNETFRDITVVPPPNLPYPLDRGANATFKCSWNWTNYREKNATITIHTLQDFTVSITQATVPRVILTITDVLFNATNTAHFNVTVNNSEFSIEEFVNVTRITVSVEKGTPEDVTVEKPPLLPYSLYVNKSVTFNCTWNWANYWNQNVLITVYADGYSAYRTEVTPPPVIIPEVLFNSSDTTYFNVTVKNPKFYTTYVLITSITITLEDGTIQDITDQVVAPTPLPYVLHPNEIVTFKCLWNWADHQNENVTITVHTLEGYEKSISYTTP